MASAWGKSWGVAFGGSFGAVGAPVTLPRSALVGGLHMRRSAGKRRLITYINPEAEDLPQADAELCIAPSAHQRRVRQRRELEHLLLLH